MDKVLIAPTPTYLDAMALEFHEKIQEKVTELKKLYRSNKVSASFFCNKDGQEGFLTSLFNCFSDNGIIQFENNHKPELTQERTLPIESYAKTILDLPKDCLRTLKNFHQKISINEDQKGFPPEYRKIADYFVQDKASNDSAEAGRLILTLSTLGGLALEMKEVFSFYTPKTLGFIQSKLNEANKNMSKTMLAKTDHIRNTINTMLSNFKTHEIQLAELTQCIEILKSQKREFVKLALLTSMSLGKKSADKVIQAQRNIQTWFDWESLVKEDEKAASQIHNQNFAQSLNNFKLELNQYLEMLHYWIKRIQAAVQSKETISPFYLGILNNLDELINNAFLMKVHIEPEMRKSLKNLQIAIGNLQKTFKHNLIKLERDFKKFPESIQKRLNYLNLEIPKILLRANPKEVKLMTLTINASYKNVRTNLAKELKQASPEALDKMTDEIHTYYSKIVQNATKLIKVSPF